MGEERIGKITHYFSKVGVAVIELEKGTLKVGDSIHISGNTTDFVQDISSIEIDNEKVPEVKPGDSFGIKVDEKVRENDDIYMVTED